MDNIDEEMFFSQNKAKTTSERIHRKTVMPKNRKTVAPAKEKKRPKKLKTMRSSSQVFLDRGTSIFDAPLQNAEDNIR